MTSTPEPQIADVFTGLRSVIDSAQTVAQSIVDLRDLTIADLRAQLEALQPEPQPLTVFGINGNRTGRNGITRTPDDRRYYGPGEFPTTPAAALLKGIEQELTISYKLPPAEVVAGKHDARIVSWHRAAAAGLPKLIPGRRHRSVPWHEPASEIKAGQFTGAQHAAHAAYIARLLAAEGLTDTFVVCPNYTVGPPSSGAGFVPGWLPDADQAPEGSLIVSGDAYGNPSGGLALGSPYGDPHDDLDVLVAAALDHGFTRVAVLEVNAPRRTFDLSGTQRIAYLTEFVRAVQQDYATDGITFDVVDVWEGVGKWDQRFTLPAEWAWLAGLLASSPQTRAA